ncbi:MAG: hypothetical protein K8I30_16745 [Anaerolineae bacterium]|nr:hypothetical protein [Anaerolineae bacterium]
MKQTGNVMDGTRIKDITSEGITYLDDDGNEQFIDFAACFANYMQKVTSPEYCERMKQLNNWSQEDWEAYLQRMRNWKRVGQRDFGAKPPYVEFLTDPVIRFEFETMDEFYQVSGRVRKVRWNTMDLA